MTIAEIHGKISGTGTNLSDRMEDLLTSDVFGCLRYLPAQSALLPFLRTARSLKGKTLKIHGEVSRVHVAFWPWLNPAQVRPCEPDAVLGLETAGRAVQVVMVEAKYHAGVSSEESEGADPSNQLARELDSLTRLSAADLKWSRDLVLESRELLFVTADMSMPRVDMADAIHEYESKLRKEADVYWTSWRFLPAILDKGLQDESDLGRLAVMEDMLTLLQRKELTMFGGVEPVAQRFALSDFEFYCSGPRSYRWPHIPGSASVLSEYVYQVQRND